MSCVSVTITGRLNMFPIVLHCFIRSVVAASITVIIIIIIIIIIIAVIIRSMIAIITLITLILQIFFIINH